MKKNLNEMKCAIFDLDGTLVDSMPMWHTVADKYIEGKGLVPEKNLWDNVKRLTETETAKYFIENYGLKESVEKICGEVETIIFAEYKKNVPMKENAENFLSLLKERGVPIALATATDRKCVMSCLERLGIKDYFTVIHTCLDLNTSKYKPLIFEKCAMDCGVAKEDAFVFEDALHCIRTAKEAGFNVVALYDKSNEELTEPPLSDWQRIIKIADINAINFTELLKDI